MTNEQLVIRVKGGDNTAGNMLELWEQNKRFISAIARKYSAGAELEDLEQSGYIGLNDAVTHYEPDKGVSFIGYAAFWIKRRMRECVDNNRPVHLSTGVCADIRDYKKVIREYEQNSGCAPSDAEICGAMRISREKLAQIRQAVQAGQIRSLNEPIENEDGETILEECIASSDDLEESAVESMDTENMKRGLWCAVDNLPSEQSRIIRLRFIEGLTLREIGEHIGVTVGQVNTIQKKAERTLKTRAPRYCYRHYYEEYLAAAPISHTGVRRFLQTWTSETERLAMGG